MPNRDRIRLTVVVLVAAMALGGTLAGAIRFVQQSTLQLGIQSSIGQPHALAEKRNPGSVPLAGHVAVILPINDQQYNRNVLAAGDSISIIATIDTDLFSPENPRLVSRTVFDMAYVIRVGPVSSQPEAAGAITVVMSHCDAQYVEWLRRNAVLRYTFVTPVDYTGPAPCLPAVGPGGVQPAMVDARWKFSSSS